MSRFAHHRYRRTTLVAVFCAAIIAGIGLARYTVFAAGFIIICLALAVSCVRHRRLAALLSIIILGISIGGLRGTVYMDRLHKYEPLYNQKIVLVGTAVDDAGYGKQKQLAFDLTAARLHVPSRPAVEAGASPSDTSMLHPVGTPLVGKVSVSGFGANTMLRGDIVQVEGKLRPGFGSKQGFMSFASLKVLDSQPTTIDRFRMKFAAGMQSAIPEPAASFAMGILIGQKATLPQQVYDDLVVVGLVHIIAVSGYNLTIILRACVKLLGDRSKYQTFAVAITLIAVFLLITGASPSIVRASLVSALSLAAWFFGRTIKPILLILMAAAITSFVSPLYPWGDIGWYLSFLAFYGVLIIGPQVHNRFMSGRLKNSVILGIALESLAAELATLPLTLYIFGQLSAISLLANVLVAGFIPLTMLLSLVAGLAGMFVTVFASWFAWPATMVLTYMLDTAHILASIPYVYKNNVYISASWMVAMFAVLITLNVLLHVRIRRDAIISAIPIEEREESTLLRPAYGRK